MSKPKNDLPLELLKLKWKLVNGEIAEILSIDGVEALFKPKAFMRGQYLTLYYSKGVHMAYHRIVWMLHHNTQIPMDENGDLYLIDHFDTNKLNNAPWNLRLADHFENRHNTNRVVVFPSV